MPQSKIKIMLVAGEPSGDIHAASLVKALRELSPQTEFEFFGCAGAAMREAGVESIVRNDDLAIVGLYEVWVKALPKFIRAFNRLKEVAVERKPDVVVFIDWPDFNLRLARSLKRKGLKTIYYISPQLWAWRSHRVKLVRRYVDLMLSILPFEVEWYKKRGLEHIEFVGNPLAGEVKPKYGREEFCKRNKLDASLPLIALLSGSRHKELTRILPVMIETASLISKTKPETQFVIPLASNRKKEEVEKIIRESKELPKTLCITQHETREAIASSDVVAVASGTATLETALLGTPLVIVYKESNINYKLFMPIINVEHFGLVNLIAGERVATELIQHDFTPQRLADELLKLLDKENNQTMRKRLKEVTSILGDGGASKKAASAILREIGACD
jgi:lipid-A-disaccharide synthase